MDKFLQCALAGLILFISGSVATVKYLEHKLDVDNIKAHVAQHNKERQKEEEEIREKGRIFQERQLEARKERSSMRSQPGWDFENDAKHP